MSTERSYQVLLGPVITEKSTMASEHNQVVFRVRMDANKTEIKEAVESLFSAKVTGISTVIQKGKTKRFRGRPGRRSDFKKAYVSLAEGSNVDIMAGV